MVSETLLHFSPSNPGRYIGSPIARGNTPARCGRVHQDQIILGKLLGTGGFGSVYVAVVRGRTVAVKTYHKRCSNPRALHQSYNSELMVYRMGLKHANVVSILGATALHGFEHGACIVMDYAGQNSLQMILNDPRSDLDCSTRLSLALQIARGLHYLHSLNIVHLDLKPANCLVSQDSRLRIADFGCCHQLAPGEGLRREKKKEEGEEEEEGVQMEGEEGLAPVQGPWRDEVAGTVAYRAPELLKGFGPSPRSDIYSLGITLWQMRTRQGPYDGVPAHAVVYQVVSNNRRPNRPCDDHDNPFEVIFSDLYTQCWSGEERDRPTSLEVVHAVGLWLDHM